MEKQTSTLNNSNILTPVPADLQLCAEVSVQSYERAARMLKAAKALGVTITSYRLEDINQALPFAFAHLNASKTMITDYTPEQRGTKIAEIFSETIRPAIENYKVGIMVQAPKLSQLDELRNHVNNPTFEPAAA